MMSRFVSMFMIVLLGFVFSDQDKLWDLGVVLDKKDKTIVQNEVDLNNLNEPIHSDSNIPKDVKALHSDNFIPPMIKEIKSPINAKNIMKAYDDMISSLSITEKMKLLKEIFLNNKFSQFFSLLKSINHNSNDVAFSLYIQNLYFSNQYTETLDALNESSIQNLNDELLFFKIKANIQLRNSSQALNDIDVFMNLYPNSRYYNYVVFEKKLIELKNER